MKKPKERTWDVWGLFLDGDLQAIFQPGETKRYIKARIGTRGLLEKVLGEELVKVRVTRL